MIVDNDSRVLLRSIDTLTFYEGEKTTHRRTSAVPQLSCQGAGCRVYKPDVVQCYNQGGTGADIQWKCEADLPSSLKIGRVQVGCEGWEHSSDPYILKGSCGLEYTLKKVDPDTFGSSSKSESGWNITANGFSLLFLLVTIFILYPLLRSILTSIFPFMNWYLPGSATSSGGTGPGGGGGGGRRPGFGGGGWGGGGPRSDPPPPYTPSSAPKPDPNAQSSGWRPGFWTGAAAGAAANSLFGRRQPYGGYGVGYDFDRSPFAGRPGYGGGGFGGGGWGGGRDPRQGSSRDHDSGGLGQIRTSTGYGGTRNR